jgi:hypothetical protein
VLRITGAGYWWELGNGIAKLVHKRLSGRVGGNSIIHRGVSRLEGSCESHVIVIAAGLEGPTTLRMSKSIPLLYFYRDGSGGMLM